MISFSCLVGLQVFGQTPHQRWPGSVQCIYRPHHCLQNFNNLTIWSTLEISGKKKKVQGWEIWYKLMCSKFRTAVFSILWFLKTIRLEVQKRDDKRMVINENWGQWQEMKEEQMDNQDENLEHAWIGRCIWRVESRLYKSKSQHCRFFSIVIEVCNVALLNYGSIVFCLVKWVNSVLIYWNINVCLAFHTLYRILI